MNTVGEHLVRAFDQSDHPNPWINKDFKKRRTIHLAFSKIGLKLLTSPQWFRLSLTTNWHCDKYFNTFKIKQITFNCGGGKKEWPNFYGMFSQNLLISAAFTAIMNLSLPQCNAIRVRTPSRPSPSLNWFVSNAFFFQSVPHSHQFASHWLVAW